MRVKHEVGFINGHNYTLIRDKAKNQTTAYGSAPNTWRWWLTVDGEYIGNFSTKAEAVLNIK